MEYDERNLCESMILLPLEITFFEIVKDIFLIA